MPIKKEYDLQNSSSAPSTLLLDPSLHSLPHSCKSHKAFMAIHALALYKQFMDPVLNTSKMKGSAVIGQHITTN